MPVVCRFAPSAHENRGPAGIIRTAVPRRGWRSTADHASLGGARQGGGNAGVLVSNRRALGGVHLRSLGAKFKFEALQFLNFGIRFYWVVVISGLSGQTSLENSRSKLEQLSNLVVRFRTWWVTFGDFHFRHLLSQPGSWRFPLRLSFCVVDQPKFQRQIF